MQNLLNKLSRNGLQTYLLLFITYSFLIIFYDPPLGLMDDFKNLEHIQSLNDNFIIYYLEYKRFISATVSYSNVFSIFNQ